MSKIKLGITAIDKDPATNDLGSFLLTHKKFIFANYDIKIIYVSARDAVAIKNRFKIGMLPMLIYEKRCIGGLRAIVTFFQNAMSPKNEDDEFSMHSYIMNSEFEYKNGEYVPKVFDEADTGKAFEQNFEKNFSEWENNKNQIKKSVKPVTSEDLERQYNVDFEEKGEIAPITIDDMEYEKWLEDLRNGPAN